MNIEEQENERKDEDMEEEDDCQNKNYYKISWQIQCEENKHKLIKKLKDAIEKVEK